MSWGWFDKGFEQISEQYNPLLGQLISTGRLKLRFPEANVDSIDTHSAALIGAALARHTALCVVLPDIQPRRATFLFAYSLLATWMRLKSVEITQQRPVLYCGVRPGVRDQLAQVSLSGIGVTLNGIFDQVHLTRTGSTKSETSSSDNRGLPRIVTAFSPSNPVALIETIKPAFIAIDLADSPKADWLAPLLEAAASQRITVVAWGTNPLSNALSDFARFGHVFKWPMSRAFNGTSRFEQSEICESLFQPFMTTMIRPLIMSGPSIRAQDGSLSQAIQCLRNLGVEVSSSLVRSATQLHWRFLRALENIAVPLSFHEAEAPNIWGARSLHSLKETCTHFRSSIARFDTKTARELERVAMWLDATLEEISKVDPPFWTTLIQIVHEEPPPGKARVIVFGSQTRKELFLLALLARLNIVPADLESLRTWITTLSELQLYADAREDLKKETSLLSIPPALEIIPLFVGIPSLPQNARLLPLFLAEEAEILARSYQQGLLTQCAHAWLDLITPNICDAAGALALLIQQPTLRSQPNPPQSRITLAPAVAVAIEAKPSPASSLEQEMLWTGTELIDEIGYLLENENDAILSQDVACDTLESPESESLWVDKGLEIEFSGGWRGLFALDQQINFVAPGTKKVEERFARALRPRDLTLIIPNQPRQSLYSLIISRVHQHPSIELHLALIRRWHEDLRAGYQRWAKDRSDPVDVLHTELRAAGSSITSSLALRFWLNGTTLCPGDVEDLRRVADILDLSFIKARYRQIGNAASRVRGLHRGLSNRLNRWLGDQARGLVNSHDAEVIDPTLGLTFGDLRSSLVLAEVISVKEVAGPFLRDILGRIERANNHDARRAIS